MTTQGAASASASAVLSFYTASAGLDVQNSVAKSRDDTGSESLSNDSESPEVSKYQHFVSSNLLLICRDEEYGQPIQKVFSWIYDLRDRECKEIPDGVLEHRLLSGLLIYSQLVDTRILKLRKQLSELQINMPAWNHVDCIVRTAQLLDEGGIEQSDLHKKQRKFVSHNIQVMLEKLYSMIWEVETELKGWKLTEGQAVIDSETKELQRMKDWIKKLYGLENKDSVYVVGPMGERPIHVCGFAIAKYRGMKQIHIADGILDGMMNFVKKTELCKSSALCEPYGKDYCAAVGCQLRKTFREKKLKNFAEFGFASLTDGNNLDFKALPYVKQIFKWLKRHFDTKNTDFGMYEDETVHFAFVACGETRAVKWSIEEDKKRGEEGYQYADLDKPWTSIRLTEIKASGLFFRPMFEEQLTSHSLRELWKWYRLGGGKETNQHCSSPTTYFGFDLLSFTACFCLASQGSIEIFDLLFHSAALHVEEVVQGWQNSKDDILKKLKDKIYKVITSQKEGTKIGRGRKSTLIIYELQEHEGLKDKTAFSKALALKILNETLEAFKVQPLLSEDFVRQLIVNRKDEFGNTMLHLAAWNSKTDLYDHLIALGADPTTENDDGLTPFTLSVRFGRWKMFEHIWQRHFTRPYWRFGNVEASVVDYSQFDLNVSGLGSVLSSRDLEEHIHLLILQKIADELSDVGRGPEQAGYKSPAAVRTKVRSWCEKTLGRVVAKRVFEQEVVSVFRQKSKARELLTEADGQSAAGTDSASEHLERRTRRIQTFRPYFKSASEIITLFKPPGWQDYAQELMKGQMLKKWDKGFFLVHFADTVVPFGIILLLFGLMWWQRRLSILEHGFWWTSKRITAPTPDAGIESACGWEAIRKSHSGGLQATLIIYGVPSLLRLAMVQSRLRPTDLDEDLDWKMSRDELINFVFMNLESMLHIIAAGLFIAIGSARVMSEESHGGIYNCDLGTLKMEKNCTSIAALVLFFNLFIVCKPYQGLGVLVQTMYRFLLKDVFDFLVMYGMLFLAFLLGLQTLHNANYEFLIWMDNTDQIFPNISNAQSLAYLANANIPRNATKLLTTETAVDGCLNKRKTMYDTAFALMEISFGDGLADALEAARTQQYECAGYSPDFLSSGLLVFWVFVTNVLFINMLVAMMNKTFDDEMKSIESKMLLDLSYRILRYEKAFPELVDKIQRADPGSSVFTFQYWKSFVDETLMVFYCLPELHILSYTCTQVLPQLFVDSGEGSDSPFWRKVRKALTSQKKPLGTLTLREVCFSPFAYKQKMYDRLEGSSTGLMRLVKKTKWRFPPELHEGRDAPCLDELICRLDTLRVALNKARVETKEASGEEEVMGAKKS